MNDPTSRVEIAKAGLRRAEAEEATDYLRNCGWTIVRGVADQFNLAESPYTKQLHDLTDAVRIEKLRRKL